MMGLAFSMTKHNANLLVIPFANAIIDKKAVMIQPVNAFVAIFAMHAFHVPSFERGSQLAFLRPMPNINVYLTHAHHRLDRI